MLHHAAVLLRAITPVALPYKFLFLLQIPHILICLSVKDSVLHILFRIPIEIFLKTVSYRQIIPKMSDPVSSVLLSTSYLHTLIVSRSILLLILIILIRLCVCFLLILSILSLLTFWILMLLLLFLWLSAEKTLIREKHPTSYCDSLTSFQFFICLLNNGICRA